ncbi:MAG: zinc-binding dehydrogenase [Xanthomonadaceae bacterium]|nr:zinc-binding dehydrogenase [Xanthomonadaceae bacterium]
MKKIVIHSAGSYDKLKIEDTPSPEPTSLEVRVKVAYSGINYADSVIRMGFYSSAKELVGWPITPGFEYSGTIDACGSGITDLKVGDQVFGITLFGGYTSEIVVPRRQIYPLPSFLTLEQAAALSAVSLSAYFPLIEMMKIRPGMKVLIHSAAGGVGSAMVQIAKAEGAEVTGVVGSTHKVEAIKRLGVDHIIDKSSVDLWAHAKKIAPVGFNVIADANGVETLKQSYEHVAQAGKLVIYGFHTMLPRSGERMNYFKLAWNYLRTPKFSPMTLTNHNKSILCFNLSYLFTKLDIFDEGIRYVLELLESGKMKPPQVTIFPYEEVAKAQATLESGKTVGKLVLKF